MADTKLTDLGVVTSLADADLVYVVDVSDTTDSAAGSSKAITKASLLTDVTIAGTITSTGDITGSTISASGDTSAGDNSAMGYTATEGLVLTGQGSTNDVTIKNDADSTVMSIPTGTINADFAGDVDVVGNFTSLGVKDAATAGRWQVSDTQTTVGTLNASYAMAHADNDQYLYISGGTSSSIGANIRLSGSTHATTAKDMSFRSDFGTWMEWDYSADLLTVTGDFTVTGPANVESSITSSGTQAQVVVNSDSVGNPSLLFQQNSASAAYLQYIDSTDNFKVGTHKAGSTLELMSDNQQTAVSIDASQNATFTGDVAAGGYIQSNTSTTAALADVTNAINTDAGKIAGAMVYNTDTDNPVWAVGSADADIWVDGAGNTAHTPV